MGKQLWYWASLAVIAAVAGAAVAQDDPNLVGYWQFEGDALDASGNGRDGSLQGNATFTDGLFGQALELGGSPDYVNIDGYQGILGGHAFSIAAWVTSTGSGDRTIVNWGSSTNGQRVDFRLYQGRLRVEHGNGNRQGDTTLNDGEWHHVALTVVEGASISYPDVILYLDGQDDTRSGTDPDTFNITASVDVSIGRRATHNNRYYPGLIDEVRIYDKELTADEVLALTVRPKAYNPSPADGVLGVTSPLLSWEPRQVALFHDVYLGTSPDLGPAELVGNHLPMTMYWHVPGLEPGTTYYWRVDEIDPDGTVFPGDVWTFMFSPLEAWGADPMDGAPNMDPNMTLTWRQGLNIVSHDVYFGADETAVAEGTGGSFKGNQYETSYVTGDLEMDTTYYWRIDEVGTDGSTVTGDVWSFTTLPDIPITDPNLMAWWNLDAGLGRRATDWSGQGNHGQFEGDPIWVGAYDGYGLEFDGIDDSVLRMLDAGAQSWPAFTVSMWVKAAILGQDTWSSPFSGHTPNTAGFQIDVDGTIPGNYRVNPSGLLFGGVTTDWIHLALTATGTSAKLYYNGLWVTSGTLNDSTFNSIALGRNRNIDNRWAGTVDDLRVYDRELSFEELELLMRIDPLRAYRPNPADNAIADVRTASPLTWTAGDNASQHEVYFGTDAAAVAAADTSDASGIYRGRQSATSYAPPESVEWGGSYAWRVDEINTDGSITTGRVWEFTVAEYLIVDDFEGYNDESPNRIFQSWLDGFGYTEPEIVQGNGTGSTVGNLTAPFAEQTIVYSGRQAMPMDYNNTISPFYSEAERTWATPQDWTFNDVDTLVLHLRGNPVDFIETAPGSVTMSAAGTDIWGVADECRFAYKRLNGDGTIIARVDSIENTHVWAKGGVMIRESLEPGSRHGAVFVTPGSGVAFQRRLTINSDSVGTTESGIVAPHWVKLTRTGNELIAQHSADGVTWGDVIHATNLSSDTVVMGGTIYIGVALTSHSAGVATTAEFSEIQTSGGVSGQWQVADIGVDHPGNSPDRLYIAVEDTSGAVAVVPHPDAGAVLTSDWQRWSIDLDEIAGVNLRAVKKMFIGVGDRDNPLPAGAGRLYIDDIRILPPLEQILTVAPADSVESTGDDGMVLSINGMDVGELVLGTTASDFEKWPDHPAPHADDFDLSTYASLDDSGYITMMFDVPVSTVFIIERGGNDEGGLQPLGADGYPVGLAQAFATSDWLKPGITINNQDAGAIVIESATPISGLMVLAPADGSIGLDPASVSGIAAQ